MPYCAIHDREEADEGFKFCYECGHTYATEKELIDEYNASGQRADEPENLWRATASDQIHFCPLCLHDFLF